MDSDLIDYSLGSKNANSFSSNQPFPNVVFDNFINDTNLLDEICLEFEQDIDWGYDPVAKEHMANKFFIPWKDQDISDLPQKTKALLSQMNQPRIINFLKDLTGIEDLFGDPFFAGGGMHRIRTGGKLSVHQDYARHPNNKNWYRRLNLLLYLNKNWENSWGGSLQLYDKNTKKKVHDIEPIFNRAVIFDTTNGALHGHPQPLNSPPQIHRNSLALYYFTLQPSLNMDSQETSAIWHSVE